MRARCVARKCGPMPLSKSAGRRHVLLPHPVSKSAAADPSLNAGNVTVRSFNSKGIKLAVHGCKKKGLCAYSTRTSHTW